MAEGKYWNRTNSSVNMENTRDGTRMALTELSEWYYNESGGDSLWVTSGNDGTMHAKSSSGRGSHYDGDKFDIATDRLEQDPELRARFLQFAESRGLVILDEYSNPSPNSTGGHLDINAMGYTGRTSSLAVTPFGSDHLAFGGRKPHEGEEPVMVYQGRGEWGDKFLNAFYDSIPGGGVQAVQALMDSGTYGQDAAQYELTQADVDFVVNALPGNKATQEFILTRANSPAHLRALLRQQQENLARARRVENYSMGWSTFATIGGSLVDPFNWAPVVGGSYRGYTLGSKVLGRLGGWAPRIEKYTRYTTKGAVNFAGYGATNVVERFYAGEVSGYQQDYTSAFMIGGAMGFLAPWAIEGLFGMAGRGSKGALRAVGAIDNAESHAVAQAVDGILPSATRPPLFGVSGTPLELRLQNRSKQIQKAKGMTDTKRSLSPVEQLEKTLKIKHDAGRLIADVNPRVAKALGNGKAYVVGKADLDAIAANLKTPINKNAKAFHHKPSGTTVLIADNITAKDNLENILAHELGVHAGLEKVLNKGDYQKTKKWMEKEIKNPSTPEMREAIRRTPEGGWEEVLGHFIETTGLNTTVGRQLARSMKGQLERLSSDTSWTEKDIKKAVSEALDHEINSSRPYQLNPDGSVIVGGLHYSAGNITNPHNMAAFYDINVKDITQTDFKGIFRTAAKEMESGGFFGTYFGTLANSLSPRVRQIAHDLLDNARMTEFKGKLVKPVEAMRDDLLHSRFMPHITAYQDIRNATLFKDLSSKLNHRQLIKEFDEHVYRYFNDAYGGNRSGRAVTDVPEGVAEAAKILKNLRDEMVEVGKTSNSRYGSGGKNLIDDPNWNPLDDELWRVLDDDKFSNWFSKCNSVEEALETLTEYARRFTKRDLLEKRFRDDLKKEGFEGEITPELFEKYLEKEIKGWAKGIVDENIGNIETKGATRGVDLSLFQRRLPLDTSGQMTLRTGEVFSFDDTLRSFDMDAIMKRNSQRMAGEAALNNRFQSPDELATFLEEVKRDLDYAVKHNHMTPKQRAKELQAIKDVIANIRGISPEVTPKGLTDAFATLLARLSYAQNGVNMVVNQIGEIGQATAYIGGRALTSLFPGMKNIIGDIRNDRLLRENIGDVYMRNFGDTAEHRIWSDASTFESTSFKDVTTQGSGWRAFDALNTGAGYASKLTAWLSMMPRLTNRMVRKAREYTMFDTVDWAKGQETKSWARDPFSKKKLAAVGIDDAMEVRIKDNLLESIQKNEKGQEVDLDTTKWQQQDPISYHKWKRLVELQSNRAIQQQSLGNTNILKNSGAGWQLFFQFKDFSLRAVNGQTMRAFANGEKEDILAAIFSSTTNIGVYAAMTTIKAYSFYGDDAYKREAYLEDRLSPENLFYAGIFRGIMSGSVLGFGRDGYEMVTGAQSFRTTVDRTHKWGQQEDRTVGAMVSDGFGQLPAFQTVNTLFSGAATATDAMVNGGNVSQNDVKTLWRGMPLQNHVLLQYFLNQMLEDSDLPRN